MLHGKRDSMLGTLSAGLAFIIWGITPIYWKLLGKMPALEIIMHRMIWSFVFIVLIIFVTRQFQDFLAVLKNRNKIYILVLSTGTIAFNWFVYIYAVNSNHVLQASLGYYITPLVNMILGIVFLKERLRPLQAVSVFIACASVSVLTYRLGSFPWISLALASSFGCYGLIRKVAPVSALVGLGVETMLLSVPAIIYLIHANIEGTGAFLHNGSIFDMLLIGSAFVTALPLLLFTEGARRVRMITIGFLQYIAPSINFILAVFLFKEPILPVQLFAFVLIWFALIIYSTDAVMMYRKLRDPYFDTEMALPRVSRSK